MFFISVQNLVAVDSGFDNMKLKIFGMFGLKTLIHAPNIGFLDDLTP